MAGREFSWMLLFAVGGIEFVVVAGGVALTGVTTDSFESIVVLTMAGYALAIVGMATVAATVYR